MKTAGVKGDNITPHHMLSAAYMKTQGVGYSEAIAMSMGYNVPADPQRGVGRHGQTRTYGRSPFLNENLRQALARDIMDARRIYMKE